jgi:hypothetical protein
MLPLSTLARSLGSFVQAVWPYARRLHQERQAGQTPLVNENDLLDSNFDETIARLCAGDLDDGWWRTLLNIVGHQYIAPEFLGKPALQEWLTREDVQTDIKALARRDVMGDDTDDPLAKARLSRAYAENTGEDERLAARPIQVVIAVVVAGHLGSIDRPQQPIARIIQEGAKENRDGFRHVKERFDGIESRLDRIGPDAMVVQAYSECAEKELSTLLKTRFFKPDGGREEICNLANRIKTEDLRYAKKSVQAKIFDLCR